MRYAYSKEIYFGCNILICWEIENAFAFCQLKFHQTIYCLDLHQAIALMQNAAYNEDGTSRVKKDNDPKT